MLYNTINNAAVGVVVCKSFSQLLHIVLGENYLREIPVSKEINYFKVFHVLPSCFLEGFVSGTLFLSTRVPVHW